MCQALSLQVLGIVDAWRPVLAARGCSDTLVEDDGLLDAGATVLDFGTIALFGQAEAIPAARRPLRMGGFEPWRARRSTRVYPTSDDESVVTGRSFR
jgi:hypothetical protein